MVLIFWILLVLLALSVFAGAARPAPYWGWGSSGLVVICLLILGLKVLGAPH